MGSPGKITFFKHHVFYCFHLLFTISYGSLFDVGDDTGLLPTLEYLSLSNADFVFATFI